MDQVFIAGCGYIGERVARLARKAGANVACMTRSVERGVHLTTEGFETIVRTLDDITEIPALDLHGRIVFYFVPPPGGGIIDQRARNFRTVLNNSSPPSKIIYVSATSVYAAKDGSVVTEQSPATPSSAMGKRRLDAETVFRNHGAAHGIPVIILRVSGIYGPGRLPLAQIHQGTTFVTHGRIGPKQSNSRR